MVGCEDISSIEGATLKRVGNVTEVKCDEGDENVQEIFCIGTIWHPAPHPIICKGNKLLAKRNWNRSKNIAGLLNQNLMQRIWFSRFPEQIQDRQSIAASKCGNYPFHNLVQFNLINCNFIFNTSELVILNILLILAGFPTHSDCQSEPVSIIDSKGYIHSPNFPNEYPPDKLCVWRLGDQSRRRLRITIQKLSLTPTDYVTECRDYLGIYELTRGDPVTDIHCHSLDSALSVVVESGLVDILFESRERPDDKTPGKGFLIYYEGMINKLIIFLCLWDLGSVCYLNSLRVE